MSNIELNNVNSFDQAIKIIEDGEETNFKFNWGEALRVFCSKGLCDIVRLILAKGSKKKYNFNWDEALRVTNNLNTLELIVEEGQILNHKFNWNSKLQDACLKSQNSIVDFVLNKGGQEGYAFDWNEALRKSCEGDNRCLALRMIDLGATDWTS